MAPGKYVYMCLKYEFADCRLAVTYLEAGKKKEGRTFADAGVTFSVKVCARSSPHQLLYLEIHDAWDFKDLTLQKDPQIQAFLH